MKKLLLTALLLPLSMHAYIVQNESGTSLRYSIKADTPNEDFTEKNLIFSGFLASEKIDPSGNRNPRGYFENTETSIKVNVSMAPYNITLLDEHNRQINISLIGYSKEQLKRKKNPVIFTINPDFTFTVSEPAADAAANKKAQEQQTRRSEFENKRASQAAGAGSNIPAQMAGSSSTINSDYK